MEPTTNKSSNSERQTEPAKRTLQTLENTPIGQSAASPNQGAIDAQRGDNDDFLSSGLDGGDDAAKTTNS